MDIMSYAMAKSYVDSHAVSLDSDGKIPVDKIPSGLDNLDTGYFFNGHFYKDQEHMQEIIGETDKLYIDKETKDFYLWIDEFIKIPKSGIDEDILNAYQKKENKVDDIVDAAESDYPSVLAIKTALQNFEDEKLNEYEEKTMKAVTLEDEREGAYPTVAAVNAALEELNIPTKTSDLENDSNFITEDNLSQPDWIELDQTKKSYIKNKPFGKSTQKTAIQYNDFCQLETINEPFCLLSIDNEPSYNQSTIITALKYDTLDTVFQGPSASLDLAITIIQGTAPLALNIYKSQFTLMDAENYKKVSANYGFYIILNRNLLSEADKLRFSQRGIYFERFNDRATKNAMAQLFNLSKLNAKFLPNTTALKSDLPTAQQQATWSNKQDTITVGANIIKTGNEISAPNVVATVAQELTTAQKIQARKNIECFDVYIEGDTLYITNALPLAEETNF